MSDFARLQGAFQRAVLDGDAGVLADLLDGPREARGVMLDVYRNAYVLRLVETMRCENPLLHAYLGDETFDAMARAYVAARPSRHPNLRWFSQDLPAFLAATPPYGDHPAVAELSALETALADAFDAPNEAVLGLADFAGVAPDSFTALVFRPHASARRLDLRTNAFTLWSALRDEESPPVVETLPAPDRIIVWRQEDTAMVRPLSVEEAMLWDEACGELPFGVLCDLAATYDDPDGAAGRVAGYLQGWVGAGLLGGFTIGR
jgi:hypothetical protein